ncbi:MAG: RNA polymerase sigma factor RpoH [Alphaproteobacteria bacterium]
MTVAAMPSLLSDAGLSRYIQEIQKFPFLTAEQELSMARQYRDHGNLQAAHGLVTSHLRLVLRVALSYRGYGLPMADLIAEGNMGLMKAVKKFDPERGFRLSTYALWWVKATIQEFILKSWSLVKIGTTASQKKLFFNLRKLKNKMRVFDDTALSPDQAKSIATTLEVSVDDVHQMHARLSGADQSLNATVFDDDGQQAMDRLADTQDNHDVTFAQREEADLRGQHLKRAMNTLKEREQAIFAARYLQDPPQTLEVLSQTYAISRERVRQIEKQAFDKVKALMLTAGPAA